MPSQGAGATSSVRTPTGSEMPAIRGSRSQALLLATLGFFGGFAGVSIFGPLVPRFTELLGGGSAAYARGFLPFAALIVLSLPVVWWLTRWSATRSDGTLTAHLTSAGRGAVRA